MKTHTFEIKEADWSTCKQRTRKWEERVNITNWIHDYDKGMYFITIKIK